MGGAGEGERHSAGISQQIGFSEPNLERSDVAGEFSTL